MLYLKLVIFCVYSNHCWLFDDTGMPPSLRFRFFSQVHSKISRLDYFAHYFCTRWHNNIAREASSNKWHVNTMRPKESTFRSVSFPEIIIKGAPPMPLNQPVNVVHFLNCRYFVEEYCANVRLPTLFKIFLNNHISVKINKGISKKKIARIKIRRSCRLSNEIIMLYSPIGKCII